MSLKESLSDEYVAGVLKKDARDSSIKYSAFGLEAMLPKRPTVSAPKPNTRFLQNIIRETDNHNAALKVKELGDAAHKLREMRKSAKDDERYKHRLERQDVDRDSRKSRHEGSGHRHSRHARDPASRASSPDETDRKRRKKRRDSYTSDTDEEDRRKRRRHREERHKTRSRETRHDRSRSRSPHRHSRRRHRRNSSPVMDIDKAFVKAQRHRTKTLHSNSHSSKAVDQYDTIESSNVISEDKLEQDARTMPIDEEDSDPLDAIIGPPLPKSPPRIRPRGRGALAASSGIDSRFSGSYDPSTDVRLDDADDDWDQALEALKDRQRWKQQGADRLRAAGFTEEEVDKWQAGGEKREEDVKWKKQGEGREWDRGKVVDVDGQVELEPIEWGRLKGS